jgi:hypothetical protein
MLIAQVASAQQTNYAVRILGFKVGSMHLATSQTATTYGAAAKFKTTGLAGAISTVYFDVTATGRQVNGRLRPTRYTERMDTGEKLSDGAMSWHNGLPQMEGARFARDVRVSNSDLRTSVDPMTVLYMVFRDMAASDLCTIDQPVFDGERLARVTLTQRSQTNRNITCSGQFRRIAGYSDDDLKNHAIFPIHITYAPADQGADKRAKIAADTEMRLHQMKVKTIYGNATVTRD